MAADDGVGQVVVATFSFLIDGQALGPLRFLDLGSDVRGSDNWSESLLAKTESSST